MTSPLTDRQAAFLQMLADEGGSARLGQKHFSDVHGSCERRGFVIHRGLTSWLITSEGRTALESHRSAAAKRFGELGRAE